MIYRSLKKRENRLRSIILVGIYTAILLLFIRTSFATGIAANDKAEDLIGPLKLRSLEQMDKLRSAKLKTMPWSGYYWPHYIGGVAFRYADPDFPKSDSWMENFSYLKNNNLTPADVNLWSPTEKYDLLVGDKNKTLTHQTLSIHTAYAKDIGGLEQWVGICNGWAVASYVTPRPLHSVTVKAWNGTDITFYPDDLKALATLRWSRASSHTRRIGEPCRDRSPARDPASGRVLDPSCFDTNPGTWHLAVVNQLGLKGDTFIFDRDSGHEIWNHVLYSYSYTFFNPSDNRPRSQLSEAQIPIAIFKEDKFQSFRKNPDAVFLVGVTMKITYIKDNVPPKQTLVDLEDPTLLMTDSLTYDLELDAMGNIVGGEWHQAAHPDYLWLAELNDPKDPAWSVGDWTLKIQGDTTRWKSKSQNPIPESWRNPAIESAQIGQPLVRVVDGLINRSRKSNFFSTCLNCTK